MNSILNAIKCAHCHEILESPVILPCSCNICNKHVSNQSNNVIRCENCGVEHQIPTNGFQSNNALKMIIKAEIANLDFGNVHNKAKISCESLEEALKDFEVLLKDPYVYTYEKINVLKNTVQLKGEELKLRIDQEMKKLLDRLEEYERKSKEYLSSNEFKVESQKFDNELKSAQSNLDLWLENLNKIKFDEHKWESIIEESDQKLNCIIVEAEKFIYNLLLNKFDENEIHVNWFRNIKIDSIFESLPCVSVKRDFMESRLIIENLSLKLEELLKNKALNGQKWSLLYRGSQFGFRASDFHSHCDKKPNALTMVKSKSGNIFGGFTSAQCRSYEDRTWQEDNSAFIFSLVNKENRPLIFELTSSIHRKCSICLMKNHGPIFGDGKDLLISDCANANTSSYSNLGMTYTHPEYPYGSEKAKTILAGTHYFQVEEIEVFQMQP